MKIKIVIIIISIISTLFMLEIFNKSEDEITETNTDSEICLNEFSQTSSENFSFDENLQKMLLELENIRFDSLHYLGEFEAESKLLCEKIYESFLKDKLSNILILIQKSVFIIC